MPRHRGTSPRTHGTSAGSRAPQQIVAVVPFHRLRNSPLDYKAGGANRLPPYNSIFPGRLLKAKCFDIQSIEFSDVV